MKVFCAIALAAALGLAGAPAQAAPHRAAIRIGYGDWPAWAAWQIAIDKGWIRQAGIDADFEWFDYAASLRAFSSGRIDANFVTNGDALVLGAGGTPNLMVMATDYSSGNDMIIAREGITSLRDLKGKRVAIELGLAEHLLLLDGLKRAGIAPRDVTLVDAAAGSTTLGLARGQFDAIGVWQPNSSAALRAVPGAHVVYTSAQSPGLIYDVLAVNPNSLAAHRDDYVHLLGVWDRLVHYIGDPATHADAVAALATRLGRTHDESEQLLAGVHLIDLNEARRVLSQGEALSSLYGSSRNADAFYLSQAVYRRTQPLGGAIDPQLIGAAGAMSLAARAVPAAGFR